LYDRPTGPEEFNSSDHTRCVAAGKPFMMVAFRPLESIAQMTTTQHQNLKSIGAFNVTAASGIGCKPCRTGMVQRRRLPPDAACVCR
jgi:hypothetical protein